MKIIILFLFTNLIFSKIDKIFKLRGDFINKNGKFMFALNP